VEFAGLGSVISKLWQRYISAGPLRHGRPGFAGGGAWLISPVQKFLNPLNRLPTLIGDLPSPLHRGAQSQRLEIFGEV